jgi:scyllo-inositol 2-dehydrogenase (NADP+)
MSDNVSTRELQVGLIGYGLAGTIFHSPFIVATPGLKLAAIVSNNPERQQQARADHPDVEICKTVDQLWERRASLDLVVVATPNVTHVPFASAAIENGLNVLVDKPLAATSADARHLVEQATTRGVLLTVYQNRRWDGDFQTLRRLVADGDLGQPVRFESRFERWRPQPKGGWREKGAPAEGGGLLMDLGSHLIDQAVLLFGAPTHVYGELDRRRPHVEVDDDAFVALTHVSGVRSHLWMSVMAADAAPRFNLRGTRAAYVKYGLDGQEDALLAGRRPAGDPLWGAEPERAWGRVVVDGSERRVPADAGAYQRLYADLERALRGRGPVPVDPNDAVRVLEIIEAARHSALEHRVIAMPH